MKHEEGSLILPQPSKAAGGKLYTQSWLPDDVPKAVILLIHGYAEHSGRYGHVAAHLVSHGYAVLALDHWGHGKSDGTPGFVPEFAVYTDGVKALRASLPSELSQKPVFLIGHSLGGLISSTYLLDVQDGLAGCVLSGPAIKAAEEPSVFLKAISGLLSRFAPRLGVIALDPNGVSRDPAVVATYLADPMVYTGKMGARLATEMLHAMTRVQEQAGNIKLPLLLLHGEEDTVAAAEGSVFLHDKAGSSDKQLKLYPHLYHEIFNEPEQEQVLADMTDWLDSHVSSVASPMTRD